MKYKVGDKIKFKSEVQRYTIRACNDRFIIASKPFNARKTFMYTLVDLQEKERSSDNYYCRFDYLKRIEAEEALELLNKTAEAHDDGEYLCDGFWLSSRQVIDLDLERIDFDKRSIHMYTDINDIYGEYSSITDNDNKVYNYEA